MDSKLGITLIFIFSLIGFSSLEGKEWRLSLKEALELAEKRTITLQLAQMDVEEGDATVREAYASAMPSISLNGVIGRYFIAPETYIPAFHMRVKFFPTNDITSQVAFQQPIWLGGRVGLALQAAKVYRQLARFNLQAEKSRVKSSVIREYFGLSLSRQLVKLMEESYEQAERHRQIAEEFYQQGLISQYDLLRAQTAVKSLEPEVERARQVALLAETTLKQRLGFPSSERIIPLDSLAEPDQSETLPISLALERAYEQRPEFRVADLNFRLREIALKVEERSIYWPNFFLNIHYQWRVAEDRFRDIAPPRWSNEFRGQVVMSLPLFDGWATSARVQKAKLGLRRAYLQKEQLSNGVELEITQVLSELQRAQKQVESQKVALKLAEKAYQIALERYEQGVGTELEVQDARLARDKARLGYLQGLYDLRVAQAEYQRSVSGDHDLGDV
ncbi:MAG: TolC family protein [bacterium]